MIHDHQDDYLSQSCDFFSNECPKALKIGWCLVIHDHKIIDIVKVFLLTTDA